MRTKKSLLFFLLFLPGITVRSGEVFPKSDAIWNMHQYSDNYFESEIIYGLIGDTIINEKTYQKMYFLSDTVLSLEKAEYVGAFRTEEEQVWFLPRTVTGWEDIQHPEFLLYDFSKAPGEYIEHGIVGYSLEYGPFFDPNQSGALRKSYVKEVYQDKQNRKHMIILSGEMRLDEWIEGIGSINGFFYIFYTYLVGYGTPSQRLACFKHQGIVEYNTNQVCNKCFCMKLYPDYVDIKNNEENTIIKLLANFQTGIIQIEIPDELLPASMDIYDTKGTLISSRTFTKPCNLVNGQSFQPGTYIYRISHLGKSLQSGKIIIR